MRLEFESRMFFFVVNMSKRVLELLFTWARDGILKKSTYGSTNQIKDKQSDTVTEKFNEKAIVSVLFYVFRNDPCLIHICFRFPVHEARSKIASKSSRRLYGKWKTIASEQRNRQVVGVFPIAPKISMQIPLLELQSWMGVSVTGFAAAPDDDDDDNPDNNAMSIASNNDPIAFDENSLEIEFTGFDSTYIASQTPVNIPKSIHRPSTHFANVAKLRPHLFIFLLQTAGHTVQMDPNDNIARLVLHGLDDT